MTAQPATFAERLIGIDTDLARLLDDLDHLLAANDGPARVDAAGELHLSPLTAEILDAHVEGERSQIVARLPTVPLPLWHRYSGDPRPDAGAADHLKRRPSVRCDRPDRADRQ